MTTSEFAEMESLPIRTKCLQTLALLRRFGSQTPVELAAIGNYRLPTVRRHLKELYARGLVERRDDDDDGLWGAI